MKTIVFCADGTWNGPGQPEEQEEQGGHRTNVFKLFLNLAGDLSPDSLRSADEQERSVTGADGRVTQIAKYLHGVGDSKNFLVRVARRRGRRRARHADRARLHVHLSELRAGRLASSSSGSAGARTPRGLSRA